MKLYITLLYLACLGISINSSVYAQTVYADVYQDWNANMYAGFPDQSNGQWQPYSSPLQGFHLEPDDWSGDSINDGFDITDNDIKERHFIERGTFHDSTGWIIIGPDPSNNPAMLIWVPGASIDGQPIHLEFKVNHISGTAPIYLNVRDVLNQTGGPYDPVLGAPYLASWGILQDGGQESGTLSVDTSASQIWIEVGAFNTSSLAEISMTVTSVETEVFTLTMQTIEEGGIGEPDTVIPAMGNHLYQSGTMVPIEASTYINCPAILNFIRWNGAGISDPCSALTTVLMDQDRVITAVFQDSRICGDECHPVIDEDLNADCIVDMTDLAILSKEWLKNMTY